MPGVEWLKITHLHTVKVVQTGYRQVAHRAHWFDGNCRFYDAASGNHSKMDLSVRGRRVFKDGSPINVPSDEDGKRITRDGEQETLSMHPRQAHAITGIRQWSVFDEMHDRILANFESA